MLKLEEAEIVLRDVLDNPDIRALGYWYANPPTLGKSKPFNPKEYLARAHRNAHNLFSRLDEILQSFQDTLYIGDI